jgi:hypothetical protein
MTHFFWNYLFWYINLLVQTFMITTIHDYIFFSLNSLSFAIVYWILGLCVPLHDLCYSSSWPVWPVSYAFLAIIYSCCTWLSSWCLFHNLLASPLCSSSLLFVPLQWLLLLHKEMLWMQSRWVISIQGTPCPLSKAVSWSMKPRDRLGALIPTILTRIDFYYDEAAGTLRLRIRYSRIAIWDEVVKQVFPGAGIRLEGDEETTTSIMVQWDKDD